MKRTVSLWTTHSKTTDFAYLGLSEEVLMDLENAQVVKSKDKGTFHLSLHDVAGIRLKK